MAQFVRPIADLDNTGVWSATPLWSKLDDNVLTEVWTNDSISNDGSPSSSETFTVDGSTVIDPLSSSGHTLRCFSGKTSGGADAQIVVQLRQGYINESNLGTLIATLNTGALPSPAGATSFSYTLSSVEADSITDYSNLQFRGWTEKIGGGANREVFLWAVELETPDAGAISYPLAANKRSFSFSGKVSSLLKSSTILLSKGGFTEVGKISTLTYTKRYPIFSSKGVFTNTGKDVSFIYTRAYDILSSKGSFSLIGKNVDLNYIESFIILSNKGVFNLSGKNSTIIKVTNYNLVSNKGSFSLTGKATSINYVGSYSVVSNKGIFNLSGKNSTITSVVNYDLVSNKGIFTYTGKNASLSQVNSFNILCNKGSFSINGKSSTIIKTNIYGLTASKGVYLLGVKTTSLINSKLLLLQKHIVSLSGKNSSLVFSGGYRINLNKHSFSIIVKTSLIDLSTPISKLVKYSNKLLLFNTKKIKY